MALAAATAARGRAAFGASGVIPNPSLQIEFDNDAPTRKAVIAQPLGWLLRRGAERDAGRALALGGVADSVQQVAELARRVRHQFYRALGARELERLIGEQSRFADSIVVMMKRRLDAGDVSIIEVDQTVNEAGRVRLMLSRAREEASVARAELAGALAFDAAVMPPLAGPLDANLRATLASGLAVDGLPVVRLAVADSAAAAARLRAAGLARLPVPSVLAGVEWGPHETPTNHIVGFAVPIPIFNTGGAVHAAARADASIASARAGEVRLTARAAIDGALVRVRESADRAAFVRDSLLPTARRLRAGSMRLLDEGRVDLLPVLDAMRSERDALQTLVSELVGFQSALADFMAFTGESTW